MRPRKPDQEVVVDLFEHQGLAPVAPDGPPDLTQEYDPSSPLDQKTGAFVRGASHTKGVGIGSRAFTAEGSMLVEVNPLAETPDKMVWCLDAKVTIDDNARFRHPHHATSIDDASDDPLERRSGERHLTHGRLEGQVGVIGATCLLVPGMTAQIAHEVMSDR
ncbi:MAG: hypothetical protein JXA67_06725 [Micromonosporaceae bacterium]|nr:hypothetical protein [Micromonosporaceae bacterium]